MYEWDGVMFSWLKFIKLNNNRNCLIGKNSYIHLALVSFSRRQENDHHMLAVIWNHYYYKAKLILPDHKLPGYCISIIAANAQKIKSFCPITHN